MKRLLRCIILLLFLFPGGALRAQATLVDSFVVDGIKHVRRVLTVALPPDQDSSGTIEQTREFIIEKHYAPSGKLIFSASIEVDLRIGVITRCVGQQAEWQEDGTATILLLPEYGDATFTSYNKLGKPFGQKTLKRRRALSQLNI